MIDHDNLEDFRDPQIYDLQDEGYYDDYPLTEQWARSLGGPLLDLACGTGRMALRMAALGYQVTGLDITPEMIARARQKAAQQAVSIEWVVADARTFHLQKQFPFHLTFIQPGGQQREKTLRVALRYVFPQEIEALLFYNGFQIRSCYGNWQQEPLTATSPAMIYVCQRRA